MHNLRAQARAPEQPPVFSVENWITLADELEPVVGNYQHAVYRYARKLIKNLRRPYLLYHHAQQLSHWQQMLAGALDDSPSLKSVANQQIQEAWQRELDCDALLGRTVRDIAPIETLAQLYAQLASKTALGHQLELAGDQEYLDCKRIPY